MFCVNSISQGLNVICVTCPTTCATCVDLSTCTSCQATYTLTSGACTCNEALGYFASTENSVCNLCGSFNSPLYGVYTANCDTCAVGSSINTSGFECSICSAGFYLQDGRCYACSQGCLKCNSASSCYLCDTSIYLYSGGSCICDNSQNSFDNGTACETCSISNCNIC